MILNRSNESFLSRPKYLRPVRLPTHKNLTAAATHGGVSNQTGPFVSCNWLQENINDVAIIDVRGKVDTKVTGLGVETSTYTPLYDDYLEAHIPGAVFWDWTRDGLDASSDVPVQLELESDIFAGLAEEKGVNSSARVVVYDGGKSGSMFAARVWWALKVHGHPDPCILAGGWEAWVARGGETELYEPCPLKVMAEFEGKQVDDWYVDKAGILQIVQAVKSGKATDTQILDVRSTSQYDGAVRRSARGGRIPGAVSLPYKDLLDGSVLMDTEALKATFAGAGINMDNEVFIYCNGGVSACVAAAALESTGFENWRVYDGSWNEWGNDPQVPIDSEYLERDSST